MIERKKSTADTLPVLLIDSSGDPVTGVVFGDVACKIMKKGGALTTKTINGTNWTEKGQGLYEIDFTTGDFDTVGEFVYLVNATGAKQFPGLADIVLYLKDERARMVPQFETWTYDVENRTLVVTAKMLDGSSPVETYTITFTYDNENKILTRNIERI